MHVRCVAAIMPSDASTGSWRADSIRDLRISLCCVYMVTDHSQQKYFLPMRLMRSDRKIKRLRLLRNYCALCGCCIVYRMGRMDTFTLLCDVICTCIIMTRSSQREKIVASELVQSNRTIAAIATYKRLIAAISSHTEAHSIVPITV